MKRQGLQRISTQFALVALAAMQAAGATPSQDAAAALTLDQAITRAFAANPTIRAATLEVGAQDGAIAQAAALPNPELAFIKEGTHGPERTASVQLTVPIELGGKRGARIGEAQAGRAVATEHLAAARIELRADVGAAFYELAIAARRARLAGELAVLAEQAAHAAARRVQAGKVSPVEETRAKVALAGVRIEALQSARELDHARTRLEAFWAGAADDVGAAQEVAAIEPARILPPPAPPIAALLRLLEDAPALKRQHADLALRGATAGVERSKRMPNLGVIVGTQRDYRDRDRQAVLGLTVPLPLFDRNQGAVLASLRRVDKAREELRAQAIRVRTDVTEAHARLHTALAEAALIDAQILPGAASAYDAAGKGFDAGKFSFLEVLDAQRTLFQARIQYLNAAAQAWRARAGIERLVGPLPLGADAVTEHP